MLHFELKTDRLAEKRVGVITYASDKYNSATVPSLTAWVEAMAELEADDQIDFIIINSETPGYFCNGLNPQTMLGLDLEGKVDVFRQTFLMFRDMLAIKKQIVAEINGHTSAAGAVVAMAADRRVMSRTGRFVFNEIRVGMFLPGCLFQIILREANSGAAARDAILYAKAHKADDAVAAGLVHEAVATPADLRGRSLAFFRGLRGMPIAALAGAKQTYNLDIINYINEHVERDMDIFREHIRAGHFDKQMEVIASAQAGS